MTSSSEPTTLFERIFEVVRSIPTGKVSTYGRIARFLGCSARTVGFAMAAVPDESDIPWHRVINYKGMISRRADGFSDGLQRAMLEAEGLRFDEKGRVNLDRHGWRFTNLPYTIDDI